MSKSSLVMFVLGSAVGAGAAVYAARKKAGGSPATPIGALRPTSPPAHEGLTAEDIAMSEEAVATQTPTPI